MFPLTANPHLLHAVFEAAALSIGAFYYRWLQQRSGVSLGALLEGGRFAVLLGCLFGAAIGNKLMFWIEMPHLLPLYWNKPEVWFAGQSMVGGLLGGLIGVELAKKLSGVRSSTGDAFVFPVLLGLMIGRTAASLRGWTTAPSACRQACRGASISGTASRATRHNFTRSSSRRRCGWCCAVCVLAGRHSRGCCSKRCCAATCFGACWWMHSSQCRSIAASACRAFRWCVRRRCWSICR